MTLAFEFTLESADEGLIEPPRLGSLTGSLSVPPKIRRKAEQVVRRVPADLEGEPLAVDVGIETS